MEPPASAMACSPRMRDVSGALYLSALACLRRLSPKGFGELSSGLQPREICQSKSSLLPEDWFVGIALLIAFFRRPGEQ
jgi:hypothetical protein